MFLLYKDTEKYSKEELYKDTEKNPKEGLYKDTEKNSEKNSEKNPNKDKLYLSSPSSNSSSSMSSPYSFLNKDNYVLIPINKKSDCKFIPNMKNLMCAIYYVIESSNNRMLDILLSIFNNEHLYVLLYNSCIHAISNDNAFIISSLYNKYDMYITDSFKNTILLHYIKGYAYSNIINIIQYFDHININSNVVDELLKRLYLYGSVNYFIFDDEIQIILLKYCKNITLTQTIKFVLLSKTDTNISIKTKKIIKSKLSYEDKFKIIQLSFDLLKLIKLFSSSLSSSNVFQQSTNSERIISDMKNKNYYELLYNIIFFVFFLLSCIIFFVSNTLII